MKKEIIHLGMYSPICNAKTKNHVRVIREDLGEQRYLDMVKNDDYNICKRCLKMTKGTTYPCTKFRNAYLTP